MDNTIDATKNETPQKQNRMTDKQRLKLLKICQIVRFLPFLLWASIMAFFAYEFTYKSSIEKYNQLIDIFSKKGLSNDMAMEICALYVLIYFVFYLCAFIAALMISIGSYKLLNEEYKKLQNKTKQYFENKDRDESVATVELKQDDIIN